MDIQNYWSPRKDTAFSLNSRFSLYLYWGYDFLVFEIKVLFILPIFPLHTILLNNQYNHLFYMIIFWGANYILSPNMKWLWCSPQEKFSKFRYDILSAITDKFHKWETWFLKFFFNGSDNRFESRFSVFTITRLWAF